MAEQPSATPPFKTTSLPGLTRQSRVVCSEPAALDARLQAGHDEWFTETGAGRRSATLGEAVIAAAQLLRLAGIDTPELDARVLLCHAAGITHEDLVANPGRVLAPGVASRFASCTARRLGSEPVSRILGFREFYGRRFRIDENTLDPRPDTETLVEAALDFVGRKELRHSLLDILDLGTGSGAILLTLLAELPAACGLGTDLSDAALAVAKRNAEALGVARRARFIRADWFSGIGGNFDLIVSNPPYIGADAMRGLAAEVRLHDPKLALDGGADGLAAYRSIAAAALRALRPGGCILVEIGSDQAAQVLALFERSGLLVDARNSVRRDLAGRARVVAGYAPEANPGG